MSFGQEILSIIQNEKLVGGEIVFAGCTESELEHLKDSQQVDFIPATYRQLMGAIGRTGIECLLDGECTYSVVTDLKNHVMQMHHPSQSIPTGAFIFLSVLDAYFFFDIQEHNDNPPVHMYYEDQISVTSATFTMFIESKLQLRRQEKDERVLDEQRSIYYNPKDDSFYTNSSNV